jgi:hypothetical protein
MASDLVGTVIEPIEWQQSAVLGSGSQPVVQMYEPTRDSDHSATEIPQSESLARTAL